MERFYRCSGSNFVDEGNERNRRICWSYNSYTIDRCLVIITIVGLIATGRYMTLFHCYFELSQT